MRVLGAQDVIDLLPMRECIDLMDEAMRAASAGRALMPLRAKMDLPTSGMLGWMPGQLDDAGVFGMKLVSVFEENFAAGMHSHNGVVVLFEGDHGTPYAVVDAAEITAIRTAAASALATRLLARPDTSVLTLMGYGAQGRQHLESMLCVREFDEVRIWGRDPERAANFATEWGAKFGTSIIPVMDQRAAVEGADVICTVSGAPEPIVFGDWLAPGQHINAVGTSFPGRRELDGAAIARSRLFVDYEVGARAQAGEFQMARDEGAITDEHIVGEIGEVASGEVQGRLTPEDVTVYKSLGLVVQDLAAAQYVVQKAAAIDRGTLADF
ncbi:MAG: ornithine cyclodeaminase family protein [Acidobacteria bacterium]|nr:ornithine cyclodeaminase family protein [Acidobacteriota bacterium]